MLYLLGYQISGLKNAINNNFKLNIIYSSSFGFKTFSLLFSLLFVCFLLI